MHRQYGQGCQFSKRTDNKVLLHVFLEMHYSKTFKDGNESINFCADRHGAVSTLLLPLVLEYELAS